MKILNAGKTPLLLKLSLFQQAGQLLQAEFEYYGRLIVDAGTAEAVVKGGDFYVLLDGLNEARDQEAVRLFVKSVLRNNTVIMTSQFDPDWGEIIKNKINLKPFSKHQLGFLLKDNDLVDRLLKADYLFDISGNVMLSPEKNTEELRLLPFTATLIAEFINKNNGQIPQTRLAIYRELIKQLIDDPQYPNLEQKAWEMCFASTAKT